MPKGRWNRQQAAREDKQQQKLDLTQPNWLEKKKPITLTTVEMYTGNYSCPFCLHSDRINAYLISRRSGYDKRLGHCPECNNNMEIKTLTANMTPEQFADFAFGYARQGYWQKVQFKLFTYRLQKIGWSQRFWNRYRELKGEDTTEKYDEYIQRKQFEQAQEEGWIEEKPQ